ncbi:MAG: hypothetical protein ACREPQ_00745 [Rhodanobacter sp.]
MDRATENKRKLPERAYIENLRKLPERAYVDNLDHGQGRRVPQSDAPIIGVVRGESGFNPVYTPLTAYELNASEGVTPAQREAMFYGSVFGFEVPAANPDMYDDDGSLRTAEPSVHSFLMG